MTANPDPNTVFWQAIETFVEHFISRVKARWEQWAIGHERRYVHEVVVGLLARQATLVAEFSRNPAVWNAHSAPLFLRAMLENCITLAWILKDPDERARQFIAYGLGQEKLLLEQEKANRLEAGEDPDKDPDILGWEQWLNSQRYTHLTEVNTGNWGPNLREMAQEVGLLDLHRTDYARWSGTVHSMWQHIVRYNLRQCQNPLHGQHRVPSFPGLPTDPVLLQIAAEYADLAINIFDDATGTELNDESAIDVLDRELLKIPTVPDPRAEANPQPE